MSDRSKFNVSLDKARRQTGDYSFDSELEKRFYDEMILPGLEDGTIIECVLQKPYELIPAFAHDGTKIPAVVYLADFYIKYLDEGVEKEIVIDTKGYARPEAVLKRKLFWQKYPDLRYEWISYSKMDGGWIRYEDLIKKRALRKRIKKYNNGLNGVKHEEKKR